MLCHSFAQNLGYYHAGHNQPAKALLDASHPQCHFWRRVNANFYDICVLDWCKLFGEKRGEHYWCKIVSNKAHFEAGLLRSVDMDEAEFQGEINRIRTFRDKFIAHLDTSKIMNLPVLDMPFVSVRFYCDYLARLEAAPGDLIGFNATTNEAIEHGYKQCIKDATAIYSTALKMQEMAGRGR